MKMLKLAQLPANAIHIPEHQRLEEEFYNHNQKLKQIQTIAYP
jgi:hypothetical protein